MSDKFFIDTNIFAYSFDEQSKKKKEVSKKIIAHALSSNQGMISYQVIQEFLNISTHKFKIPLNTQDREYYLKKILFPLCEIYPNEALFLKGLDIQNATKYSFYDSMIIAAAVQGRCAKLYTEDLQSGQTIQGIRIENPF